MWFDVVVFGGSSLFLLAPPLLLKFIIDDALPQQDFQLLWQLAGIGAGLYLFGNLTRYLGRNRVAELAEKTHLDLRERVFRKLLDLDVQFHTSNRVGKLAATAQFDTNAVKTFIASVIPGGVDLVVTVIGTAAALLYLEPKLFLLAFIPLPGALFVAYVYRNKVRPLATRRNELYGEVYGTIHEALQTIEDIKIYDRQGVFQARLAREAAELEEVSVELAKQQNRLFPSMNLGISLFMIGILVAGGYMVAAGSVTVGTLVAYYYYVSRAFGPLRSASSLVLGYYNAQAAIDRIESVLNAERSVQQPEEPVAITDQAAHFELRNVSFSYGQGDDQTQALQNLDLDLPAGHRVSLLGPSGSGKSTTGKLIPRLFDPQDGSISRNGIDLRDLDLEELRATIGYVGQDVFLFDGSIRENILFGGEEDTPEQRLQDAVRHACVDEILERKNCDLDAPVGEGGGMLSGGQKKRVALARALIRNPSILVIDQLAADLQEDLCREIFENIRRHYDVSILYLGHRVPAGFGPDAVYWMEEGTIKRQMEPTDNAHGAA